MRVLAVIHGADVGPELFGDVIAEAGHELVEWDIRSEGPPPSVGVDAVLVLGGAQNVGEEDRHPWLHGEYDALRGWVASATPLFCVCLGAQTLAHALGGEVRRLPAELAGFYDTELTPTGLADPVLGALPPAFRAFNGNRYGFDPPPGAALLARGPVAQAFRAGDRAWAVQFHPEIRRDQVLGWWADEPPSRPPGELQRELALELPAWQEHGRRLFRAFLAVAG